MTAEPRTPASPTTSSALSRAAREFAEFLIDDPRRVAETLLGFVLGCDRASLFAHPERQLTSAQHARFQVLVLRRTAGEPTQHLTGVQEFWGREFEVSPAVLIPRPETEGLVEAVLENLRGDEQVLDAGCGSGCLAITLAAERPTVQVVACDLSAEALAVARRNASRHEAAAEFFLGDWADAVATDSLDVLISNPPYVPERDRKGLSREVLHDPERALFAGEEGLDAYRRLIPQAARVLRPGGLLALELGRDSLPAVREMLGGWTDLEVRDDLAGIPRVVLARNRN